MPPEIDLGESDCPDSSRELVTFLLPLLSGGAKPCLSSATLFSSEHLTAAASCHSLQATSFPDDNEAENRHCLVL